MTSLFSFRGIAHRGEWWLVSLVSDLIAQGAILGVIFAMQKTIWFAAPIALLALAAIWVAIAVSVRRLRDRKRHPLLLFAVFIPVIGQIWYIVECGFLPSANRTRKTKVVKRMVSPENQ